VNTQIIYEFPLNERMRVFMRLEHLFIQLKHFLNGNTIVDKRAVMTTLIDILSIFSRNNLKSELLKESERLSKVLSESEISIVVSADELGVMRLGLEEMKKKLYATRSGKIGAELIASSLFQSFTQRNAIPGGSCSFDLPAFHYWLSQDEAAQLSELDEWTRPLLEIHEAIQLVLNFIRQGSISTEELAKGGFFQSTLPLDSHESVQLLRVQVPQKTQCFAEISGGRHRFTVRFMLPALESDRSTQTTQDISFTLTRCQL
jgi:cell division protein ZapD